MEIKLSKFISLIILIPCLIICLFFTLRLGLFSYSSRSFNCSKTENNCKIISKYLLSDKEDVISINISDIKKVEAEYHPFVTGFGHYVLNIYTPNDKYTYLEAGGYFRSNLYSCATIITNFFASKKQNLNLAYNVSAFKSVMGILISLCIIMSFIFVFVFRFNKDKYIEIMHLNTSKGNGFLNLLPISFSMLLISILSTFIINKSQIAYEKQVGTTVGLIYVGILALISIFTVYQVFFPDKLNKFFKRTEMLPFCSFILSALIFLLILIFLIYGVGVVSFYIC